MRMKNANQLKGKIKNVARSRGVDPRVKILSSSLQATALRRRLWK